MILVRKQKNNSQRINRIIDIKKMFGFIVNGRRHTMRDYKIFFLKTLFNTLTYFFFFLHFNFFCFLIF